MRKTEKPVYLTCSVGFGVGASLEEESDALRRGIKGVIRTLKRKKKGVERVEINEKNKKKDKEIKKGVFKDIKVEN